MDFQPPDPADLANVYALNAAFLDALRTKTAPDRLRTAVPDDLQPALASTDAKVLHRLHRCPFLLFSLAERDSVRWTRLFDRPRPSELDLIDALPPAIDAPVPVILAALGFLWQLARRQPYAARVVSGASLGWCERLSGCTLIDIHRFALAETGLLGFRHGGDATFWRRLLLSATSEEKSVRQAARLAALQMLLTEAHADRYRAMAAAACALPVPPRKVADKALVSKRKTRGYNTPPDESATDLKPHKNLRKR